MNAYLRVGEIVKPQGVRGEVKVLVDSGDASRFEALDSILLQRGERYDPIRILDAREREGFAYLTLEGVHTREAAEALRGTVLCITRDQAPELSPDENYIVDLIGLKAVDTTGREIGTLIDVQETGGVDVYAFQTPKGILRMPALKRAIPRVDIEAGVIVLDERVLPEISLYDEGR